MLSEMKADDTHHWQQFSQCYGKSHTGIVCNGLEGDLEGVLDDLHADLLVEVGQSLLGAFQLLAGIQQSNSATCPTQNLISPAS